MALVHYIPRPAPDAVSSLDLNHLDRLRRDLRRQDGGPDASERQVAQQFEALLLQQVLKQADIASERSGLFDSAATRMATGMRNEQLALDLSRPGMGLADVLLEQIRDARGSTPASAAADAPAHVRAFVDEMGPAASVAARRSGLPASLILGQAALESGWGRREIKNADGSTSHNLFGIKATGGWTGKVAKVMTTEYIDGKAQKLEQAFRAYDSYTESFSDYARLISQNQRYSAVLQAESAQDAARRIQAAGYATDPAYADKLISIMAYFTPGLSQTSAATG